MEIVIGSRNVHKIREFRDIFKALDIKADFLSLLNFPDYTPPEEVAGTLQENAILKAEHGAKALGRWVLADDSGLFVPALGGLPGVRSHRYASGDPTDLENNQKLLREMQEMEEIKRSAYFECCLALASPEELKKCVTARCEGYIAMQSKGMNGFGYDVLFIKNEYDKTFAELNESTKNRVSHRRKACEKMLPTLETVVTAIS